MCALYFPLSDALRVFQILFVFVPDFLFPLHGGLFCGLFSGAGMFLFFAALALIMGSAIGFNLLVRLVLCAFFGAVGGILGINLQRKRKYV